MSLDLGLGGIAGELPGKDVEIWPWAPCRAANTTEPAELDKDDL
jgi:hypothetical protein